MATLQVGSSGAEVTKLQTDLKKLGFYAGSIDSAFGPGTKGAVEDFQARRGGLTVDGIVGPNTSNAIQAALSSTPPTTFSFFDKFKKIQDDMLAHKQADNLHFAFLDRGIDEVQPGDIPSSPKRSISESLYKKEIPNYPSHLQTKTDGSTLLSHPKTSGKFAAYPDLEAKPAIEDGLDFLSPEIEQACVCIGSFDATNSLQVRWLGRNALNNVQFWSATKFIGILNVVCQANKKDPSTNIADCNIRGSAETNGTPFQELLVDVISYRKDAATEGHSNSVAAMFKRFQTDPEIDLQTWVSHITGNRGLKFQGAYGFDPFREKPNLFVRLSPEDPKRILVNFKDPGSGDNHISAYDLTRLISMVGWHNHLQQRQLPGAQWHSLSSVVQGMGTDTARYVDVAIEALALQGFISSPAIISKLGFGTTGHGEDALTYTAFVQFVDERSTPAKLRSLAMALRIPTTAAKAPEHDAKMAAEVTEIIRRVVTEELA